MPLDTAVMYFVTLGMAGFFGCFMVHMVDGGMDKILEKNELRNSAKQ